MHAVRSIERGEMSNLNVVFLRQARIRVSLVCHLMNFSAEQCVGRVYGNTRMDNVWAFREAYVEPLGERTFRLTTVQIQQGTGNQDCAGCLLREG